MEPLGKITPKSSWNTNLILQLEEETVKSKTINFNRATETLDGSIKIFSVRLDNLTDDTQKILTKVVDNNTEVKEKQKRRRKECHLERGRISFLRKKENCIFINKLEKLYRIFKDGKLIIESNLGYSENQIDLFEDRNEIFTAHQINSPEIIDFSQSITPSLFENVDFTANVKNIEIHENNEVDDLNFEMMEDEIAVEVEKEFESEGEHVHDITDDHMIYSRGFAGPSFWKMKNRRIPHKTKEKKKREPKQKTKIDFNGQYDFNKIYEQGNIFIPADILNSRKKNSYQLPADLLISQKDLYSLNYLCGFFNEKSRPTDLMTRERSFSFYQDNSEVSNFIPPLENEDEIINNIQVTEKNEMAALLHQKYKRKQKNVDMQFLKENIYENIIRENKKELSFKSIVDHVKPVYFSRKHENLSDHFCFISLLHLANENDLSLVNENNDIKIIT